MDEINAVDFDDLTDEEKVAEMIMMSNAMRTMAEMIVLIDQEHEIGGWLESHEMEREQKLLDSCYDCVAFYNEQDREKQDSVH